MIFNHPRVDQSLPFLVESLPLDASCTFHRSVPHLKQRPPVLLVLERYLLGGPKLLENMFEGVEATERIAHQTQGLIIVSFVHRIGIKLGEGSACHGSGKDGRRRAATMIGWHERQRMGGAG